MWSMIWISQYFIHSKLQSTPDRLWVFLKPVMYDLHQKLLRIIRMFIHQLLHIGMLNPKIGLKSTHLKGVILRIAGIPHKLENGSTV